MGESTQNNEGGQGPEQQARLVGRRGIIILALYLIFMAALNIYVLVKLWSSPAPDNGFTLTLFRVFVFEFGGELRLILIVLLSGSLGSQVHALRSFFKYVGAGKLLLRWIPMYLILPVTGSSLALLFYFVIRGGFFSVGTGADKVSEYGFAAISGLIGLFVEEAISKLKKLADTLLEPKKKGEDHLEDNSAAPGGTEPGNVNS